MSNTIQIVTEFDPALFSQRGAPLASIYLSTHRYAPDNQQDPIRYKNLVAEIEKTLKEEYTRAEYEDLLESLLAVSEDRNDKVRRHAKEGLAVLASPDATYIYHLDYPVDELALVADSFHIKPLIKNFQYGSHYFLLALSADDFSLYRGDFHSLAKLSMPQGVATKFSEVFDDFDVSLTGVNGTHGKNNPDYHGYGEKSEVIDNETIKHFRYVNDTVNEHFLTDNHCPVILVSLPQHQTEFRRIATISNLLNEAIEKPFESMSEEEVLQASVSIIEGIQEGRVNDLAGVFGLDVSQERASADPSVIAMALAEKKVATLFVEDDRLVPGDFNEETGAIILHLKATDDSDDLSDDFAQATYLQGGEVYVLEAEKMPADTGVAALFRY